jgi:hypothetical protein
MNVGMTIVKTGISGSPKKGQTEHRITCRTLDSVFLNMASKHLDDIRFGGGNDDRPFSSSACPVNVSLGAEVGTNLCLACASLNFLLQ